MALSIKNDQADRLARELAATTGESLTDAVVNALRERLEREKSHSPLSRLDRLRRLREDVAALPVVDDRRVDAIIGYDERGLPA